MSNCPLVAAVVAAEAGKATTIARQKAAVVAADSKIRQVQQKTVRLLSMTQRVHNGGKTMETDEKEGIEQSLW